MLVFDLETTNLDFGDAREPDNRVILVAWQVEGSPVRYFYGNLLDASAFWSDLQRAERVCAYNAKFEAHWLLRYGFDIDSVEWHDPMLAEAVIQGNRRPGFSLDATARRYGLTAKDKVVDAYMKSGVCPSDLPKARLIARCVRDVKMTAKLFACQKHKLDAQYHLYRTRCELMPVLTRIEAAGMQLDAERVHEEYVKVKREYAEVQQELEQLTGGINVRSGKQLAEFLYDTLGFEELKGRNKKPLRTAAGARKTDKATLAKLTPKTAKQRQFLELQARYAKLNAALTKSLEFFEGACKEKNGHIYASFNQTVAATHRLTSSAKKYDLEEFGSRGVQFQNMAGAYKRLFTARPGYKLVEVDASQLEFRVAAYVGDDAQAREDIQNPDFDAHCTSASVMNGVEYSEFLQEYRNGNKDYAKMRKAAKADTFKPLYGGTRGTPEQEAWYEEFKRRYSGIAKTQDNWITEVEQTGELELPWGMKFYWEFSYNRRGTAIDNATKRPIGPSVCNYPVQSLATAEIVPIAIIKLYHRVKDAGLDVVFVNTVHDSIIAEVKESQVDDFLELAKPAFTTDVYNHLQEYYGINFDVPLGMEAVIGSHWAEGEEVIYDDVINQRQEVDACQHQERNAA